MMQYRGTCEKMDGARQPTSQTSRWSHFQDRHRVSYVLHVSIIAHELGGVRCSRPVGRLPLSHCTTRGNSGKGARCFLKPHTLRVLPTNSTSYCLKSSTTTQPISPNTLYFLSLSCSCAGQFLEERHRLQRPPLLIDLKHLRVGPTPNWFQAQPLFLNAAPSAVILLRFPRPRGHRTVSFATHL